MKFCCVGDNCIDYYVDEKVAKPGGNPVNVAVYIKQLGGESSYIGAVGKDEFGKILMDGLSKQGVDVSHVQIKEGNTAVTLIKIEKNERILGDYDEGVMEDFKLTSKNMDFIKQNDIVISGFWGNVHDEFKKFKEYGLITAFDFATNLYSAVTNDTVPYVDYAFFSENTMNEEEIKKFMKDIHKLGPKLVIVTRGENGSIVYDGKQYYYYGIVKCDVVDTLGAGDSYIAGFLFSLMQGNSIEKSMEAGATRSSKTISYEGAW